MEIFVFFNCGRLFGGLGVVWLFLVIDKEIFGREYGGSMDGRVEVLVL